MTTQVRVKIIAQHTEGDIPDYHEWVFLGRTEYRDSIGRSIKGAYRCWLVVHCNNWGCPGKAIVRDEALLELVNELAPLP